MPVRTRWHAGTHGSDLRAQLVEVRCRDRVFRLIQTSSQIVQPLLKLGHELGVRRIAAGPHRGCIQNRHRARGLLFDRIDLAGDRFQTLFQRCKGARVGRRKRTCLLHPLETVHDLIEAPVNLTEMLSVHRSCAVVGHHADDVFQAALQPGDRFRLGHALFHGGQTAVQAALFPGQDFQIVEAAGHELHPVIDTLDKTLDIDLFDKAAHFSQFRAKRFDIGMALALQELFHAFGNADDPVFQHHHVLGPRQRGKGVLDFIQARGHTAQDAGIHRRTGQFIKTLQDMGIPVLQGLECPFHVRAADHVLQVGDFLADLAGKLVVLLVGTQTLDHVGQATQFRILPAHGFVGAARQAAKCLAQRTKLIANLIEGLFLRRSQCVDAAAKILVDMHGRFASGAYVPIALAGRLRRIVRFVGIVLVIIGFVSRQIVDGIAPRARTWHRRRPKRLIPVVRAMLLAIVFPRVRSRKPLHLFVQSVERSHDFINARLAPRHPAARRRLVRLRPTHFGPAWFRLVGQ